MKSDALSTDALKDKNSSYISYLKEEIPQRRRVPQTRKWGKNVDNKTTDSN